MKSRPAATGIATGQGNSKHAAHFPSLPIPTNQPRICFHDGKWWRREAARLGSDWPGVLALHAAVVAAWRGRHDPDYGDVA